MLPFYKLLEDSVRARGGRTAAAEADGHLASSRHRERVLGRCGRRTSPDIAVEGLSTRGTDTETSFDIAYPNCSLQPFDDAATYGKSFKDRLLVIEGLDLASDGHDAVGEHPHGQPAQRRPAGKLVARSVPRGGVGARARRRARATSCSTSASPNLHPGHTLSFSAGGVGVGKIISPFEAFDYLFSGFVPPDDAAGQAALMRRNQLGQSVVDSVRDDCNRLRAASRPPEQQKMDQHLARDPGSREDPSVRRDDRRRVLDAADPAGRARFPDGLNRLRRSTAASRLTTP